ncbi:MAG TPA: molybdenum cofactor guanylyltransferase [Terriglobales bacterium]|nr:molybdenum cofactor guanylyltransferase [Terriglobales bacterium]
MYYHSVGDLTAFILAGGKSTRMGADKAFLQLEGRTLLARALEMTHSVTQEVRVVGSAAKFSSFGNVIEDVYPERGPLGGIHAALRSAASELNLILAVDLPFIEPRFLEYLAAQARETTAAVTVPRAGGGWQPLCAIYRRQFASVAEQSLLQGGNKIDPLFAQVETRVVEATELSKLGFSENMFQNLNSPEEWAAAERQQRAKRS